MASISKASLFLAALKLASASSMLAFPNAGCDQSGYYITITADQDSCTETYFSDSDFMTAGNNSGEYQAWFDLQTTEADGCALVIGSNSVDAKAPPCGECVELVHTAGQCVMVQLPTPWYAWECCGDGCQSQCGQTPAKRHATIADAVEALEARTAKPDIANLKNRSPASPVLSAPKAKRSDCSFTANGSKFSQAGTPVKVSDTFNTCQSSNGCMETFTSTAESSFSNTFGVSESTEAGLFDIVSETVSFDYSHTWEQSKSVSVSGSYTFPQGQGGYLTFAPLSQCIAGTFAGADCASMGIPTGTETGNACVPETINNGDSENGDINAVTSI